MAENARASEEDGKTARSLDCMLDQPVRCYLPERFEVACS